MSEAELVNVGEGAIKIFNERLTKLIEDAKIEVTDQASLVRSGDAKISLDSYIKSVKSHFGNELTPLEERVKRLKNQIASLTSPAKTALDALVERQRSWTAEEKRKADAETKRLQEEADRRQVQQAEQDLRAAEQEATEKRRETVGQIREDLKSGAIGKREAEKRIKEAGAEEESAKTTAAAVAEEEKAKPAPTVRVAPNIPAVAGVKNQTYYYAEITDPGLLANQLTNAIATGATQRIQFLLKFFRWDDAEVGRFARETKNNEQVMKLLPGVRAWSKG